MAGAIGLILFGRQGAGKGTQAAKIASKFSIPAISTGEMFRANIRAQSPLGKEIELLIAAGQLVPDDLTMRIVEERLAQPDAQNGWLLDGFPRTPNQASKLIDLVGEQAITAALNIEVGEEVVVHRLSIRRICSKCDTVYSTEKPTAIAGVCDRCGGELIQRPDDTEESIRKRLALYAEQTEPLLAWFAERSLLLTIDGLGSPDDVFGRITSALADRV